MTALPAGCGGDGDGPTEKGKKPGIAVETSGYDPIVARLAQRLAGEDQSG